MLRSRFSLKPCYSWLIQWMTCPGACKHSSSTLRHGHWLFRVRTAMNGSKQEQNHTASSGWNCSKCVRSIVYGVVGLLDKPQNPTFGIGEQLLPVEVADCVGSHWLHGQDQLELLNIHPLTMWLLFRRPQGGFSDEEGNSHLTYRPLSYRLFRSWTDRNLTSAAR